MADKLPKTAETLAPLPVRQEEAAQLVAAGRLTMTEIATRVGVKERQFYTWRQTDAFKARLDAINAAFAEEAGRYAIAQRARRLAAMDERYRKLHHIIEDRAAALSDESGLTDPLCLGPFRSAALASGFDTGLVTLEWVTTPKGGFKPQFKVDTGLSAEMRALEKQAAQERGEWVDKVAPTDPKGEKPYVGAGALWPDEIEGMSDDDLAAAIAERRARLAGAGAVREGAPQA